MGDQLGTARRRSPEKHETTSVMRCGVAAPNLRLPRRRGATDSALGLVDRRDQGACTSARERERNGVLDPKLGAIDDDLALRCGDDRVAALQYRLGIQVLEALRERVQAAVELPH